MLPRSSFCDPRHQCQYREAREGGKTGIWHIIHCCLEAGRVSDGFAFWIPGQSLLWNFHNRRRPPPPLKFWNKYFFIWYMGSSVLLWRIFVSSFLDNGEIQGYLHSSPFFGPNFMKLFCHFRWEKGKQKFCQKCLKMYSRKRIFGLVFLGFFHSGVRGGLEEVWNFSHFFF